MVFTNYQDQSIDTNSLSADSQEAGRSPNSSHKSTSKKGEWEILEGLKEGQRFDLVPRKFEGFLLKRRKWPLKGWHKRYFVLEKSTLIYSKSVADLARGKVLGKMDIGMSVISTKARRRRIDIDADTLIFHLKVYALNYNVMITYKINCLLYINPYDPDDMIITS
ncbi:oxysterol-binding protein-related protein 6 isoform X2 [Penaeus vannamei]|uniref:oxysterol-binding protein-related protein 6 isoform X2 n=1 Tax=Penaeus vannamei TaxID=6689 RepID=UPI00387F7BDA